MVVAQLIIGLVKDIIVTCAFFDHMLDGDPLTQTHFKLQLEVFPFQCFENIIGLCDPFEVGKDFGLTEPFTF